MTVIHLTGADVLIAMSGTGVTVLIFQNGEQSTTLPRFMQWLHLQKIQCVLKWCKKLFCLYGKQS